MDKGRADEAREETILDVWLIFWWTAPERTSGRLDLGYAVA